MLHIYTGKIVYERYATETIITFVVPDGKVQHHPCLAYWQWEVEGSGAKNVNTEFTGQFQETTDDQVKIRAYDMDTFWFLWDLKTDFVQMMDKASRKCGPPIQLTMVYPNTMFGGRVSFV
ncbi:hypothetical protein Q9L58_004063 [Maublancomyces gigas]|uniref:Uncharacterized protein n=1 Tax=Discina gigas TaxID=1032678 RepID=A0ABR3GM01_9PEZI